MKIYTGIGDKGRTVLFTGQSISKNDNLLHAYGTLDELNSILGIVIAITKNDEVKSLIYDLQNLIIMLSSDLATPYHNETKVKIHRFNENEINYIENTINAYENKLKPLKNFILPGGSLTSCYLHNARTVCRRAERYLADYIENKTINEYAYIFMNRLSDLFFSLSRYANQCENIEDIIQKPIFK